MEDNYPTVESVYTPESTLTELTLKLEAQDNEWIYAFYLTEEDIPEYLQQHARRNNKAEELDETVKLSRMVEQHLNPDAEKEW